ncbi:MAG: hypothetical protein H0W76_17895 [Pyrinomonadaceae bacterium]|nr:hypothetical protein [Pyrinomonadaceae bacterium]
MSTIDIVLTDLTFPAKLGDEHCKFRPLISIRYRDSDNKIMFAREAMPGLGKRDYWECEKGNKDKPGYVRHNTEPKVDMGKLATSRREIIFDDLDIKKLESLELEIFDIDIKTGFLDGLRDNVLKVLPVAVAPFIPVTLPLTLTLIKGAVEKGTGKKVSDLEKGLISKAMGREDGVARSLWTNSTTLTSDPQQTLTMSGSGLKGDYSVTLRMEVT